MISDTSSLELIMARFPEHRDSLERLDTRSESFESLCDDIRECLVALDASSQSMEEEAPAYRKEYRMLLHELDEELLECVENERELVDYRTREREF